MNDKTMGQLKAAQRDMKNKTEILRDSARDMTVSGLIEKRRCCYFEGLYLKHQKEDAILVLIPGICIDKKKRKRPFLQVMWNDGSCFLYFNEEDCMIDRRQGRIVLENNLFSSNGVKLNIKSEGFSIHGIIRYGPVSPLRYPVMGPFCMIPFMQCSHEVYSMGHSIYGKVWINGKAVDFYEGKGYIEGDKGSAFPKEYFWVQSNEFARPAAIMISVARVPFLGFNFEGCICIVRYQGKEYRFATYLGAKVICKRETAVIIKQGKYTLKVFLSRQRRNHSTGFSHSLLAPESGKMNRRIKEGHLFCGRFLLYQRERQVFDLTSDSVSYEYVADSAIDKKFARKNKCVR